MLAIKQIEHLEEQTANMFNSLDEIVYNKICDECGNRCPIKHSNDTCDTCSYLKECGSCISDDLHCDTCDRYMDYVTAMLSDTCEKCDRIESARNNVDYRDRDELRSLRVDVLKGLGAKGGNKEELVDSIHIQPVNNNMIEL